MNIRTGFGYDIHRFDKNGHDFLLAGIKIEGRKILSHSDGDCLYHALSNALLSAIGMDDIGVYFPDTSKETENMDSEKILLFALKSIKEKNYQISNIVIDIQLEKVRLKTYKEAIKKKLSQVLQVDENQIAIHTNTKEGLDAVGLDQAVVVYSEVCLVNYEVM